jgi:uncharacterized repeat protein (TIGR01451 family)
VGVDSTGASINQAFWRTLAALNAIVFLVLIFGVAFSPSASAATSAPRHSAETTSYQAAWQKTPSIGIVKSASVTSFSAAGTLVTYYYEVTNTGSTTLSTVGVTDPMVNLSPVVCPDPTLAAGASEQCSATYTTSASDVTNGSIHNTGTASGTYCSTTVTASSSLTIPYLAPVTAVSSSPSSAIPAISLAKTAASGTYDAIGQVVTYTYVITNTGNVILSATQYIVTDNLVNGGAAFDCGAPQVLAIGASITCTNTYKITSSDLSSGSVTNLATATNGSQTSPVATATITATASVTTTIHTSPSKVPPAKIPSSAPSTGAGGAAKLVYNVGSLFVGGLLILTGLVAMGFAFRRRRA